MSNVAKRCRDLAGEEASYVAPLLQPALRDAAAEIERYAREVKDLDAECERRAAENELVRAALKKALLWTDAEHDVAEWRDEAEKALAADLSN